MRHIALRLLVALLTFFVGISVSSLLSFERTVTTETVSAPTSVLVEVPARDETQGQNSFVSHSACLSTISAGILNGKAISKPLPVYPPIAKAARAQGPVVVEVVVAEDGSVVSAEATSGHPLLQAAAVAAARQAKFSPTHLSGIPVKVRGTLTYNFVIE